MKKSGKIKTGANKLLDRTKRVKLRLKPVSLMSEDELMKVPSGSLFVFDTECYRNFWFCAFKHLDTGKYVVFERSPDADFDEIKMRWFMWRFCIIGFNSRSYDVPMMELAMSGFSNDQLKEANDFIIKSGPQYGTKKVTPFDVQNKYGVKIGQYNHIDLFNVCPVNGGNSAKPMSLKLYAARLHAERLQDLPFDADHILTKEDADIVRPYCCNDLDNTEILFNELAEQIELRIEMSERYGIDLRSKSDAQIAEAVVTSELEKILGYRPKAPETQPTSVKYKAPSHISFVSPELKKVLKIIENCEFFIDAEGKPTMPSELEKLDIKIGGSTYNLGMGGLHSTEQKIFYSAEGSSIIADNDVESFYPRTILNLGLFPKHLGEAFLTVYNTIVETRIDAKGKAKTFKDLLDKKSAKHFKTIADSLKIVINGLFGKFGNKYSVVYAPELLLTVTITGQLVLLMLIEAAELMKIRVISGNTDGFVSVYDKSQHEEFRKLIAMWETHTGYKTEETRYWLYAARDVNAYIAGKMKFDKKSSEWIKDFDEDARFTDEKLGMKTKGQFCERGSALNSILSKNPESLICSDAVLKFLRDGKSIESTIRECTDIRRFTSSKNVAGGGHKDGVYLGKVVRFYYAKGETDCIYYAGRGSKVSKSEGGKPLMELPEAFPEDVDYEKYINTAIEMLYDCGRFKKSETSRMI